MAGGTDEGGASLRPLAAPLVLFVVALVVRLFVVDVVRIEGPGMVPALLPGDTVLTLRGGGASARLGDIVLMDQQGSRYARRVAALGGQRVAMVDGELEVDGQPVGTGERRSLEVPMGRCGRRTARLVGEQHGRQLTWVELGEGGLEGQEVPTGALFLLGDHRAEASDSRVLGMVDPAEIEGRVLRVLWSTDPCDGSSRWGRLMSSPDGW